MRTRDATARELLDAEELDALALARNLRDIRRINALLGWTRYTVRTVSGYLRARGMRRFTLLDVASGSADIPQALARWAAGAGVQAEILATDIHPEIVRQAAQAVAEQPSIRVEQRNALALPDADGCYDIALCTLALHHFAPDDAVTVLRELARVGRHVFVFDLLRAWPAYYWAYALTRLLRMEAMTRHDAPVSVRRGYTAEELRALAARAGLVGAQVRVGFPYRLALSAPGTGGPS